MTAYLHDVSDRFFLILRWTARLIGAGVIAVVVLFLVGTSGFNPLKLSLPEALLMVLFWTAVAGLAVAWKWEGLGGAITIGSLALFYVLEWLFSDSFPRSWAFGVLALPGLLFLCSAVGQKCSRRLVGL